MSTRTAIEEARIAGKEGWGILSRFRTGELDKPAANLEARIMSSVVLKALGHRITAEHNAAQGKRQPREAKKSAK